MITKYYFHTCKCGCTGLIEIKVWHKYTGIPIYIKGHNKSNLGNNQIAWNKGKVQTEEVRNKISKSLKNKYKNNEIEVWNKGTMKETNKIMKIISEKQKGKRKTKETIQNMSDGGKGKILSEEHKQKISLSNKENYTEERKLKISIGNKGKIVSEKTRKKQAGAKKGKNNPNWNNGSSFEPYSPEFNKEKKQQVLERDNYKCQCPNCEHKSNKLDIHHIDYDKKNNNVENLITLCNKCHTKTTGKNNRIYWIEFYQNMMNKKLIDILI